MRASDDPMMQRIFKLFGPSVFRRSSANVEFPDFVRRVASGRVCMEIGTLNGLTAFVMSQLFDQVIVVSIDAEHSRGKKYEIAEAIGCTNVRFIDCKTNEEKAEVVNGLQFDFAYVDGDHHNDTESDFALVRRCGRVLFHEYWPKQPSVWELVNSLPREEVTIAQHACLAYWGKR